MTQAQTPLKALLLAALLGVAGCVSTATQKESASEGVPTFDGHITPIETPVLLRHKPGAYRIKVSVTVSVSIKGKTERVLFEVSGKSKTRRLGDLLSNEFVLERFNENGKTLPIPSGFGVRAVIDARGSVREAEVLGVDLPDKKRAEVQKIIKSVQNIPLLPEAPLRSGDTVGVGLDHSFFQELLGEKEDATWVQLNELLFQHMEYTVAGLSVVNNRKLLVESIDKTTTKHILWEAFQITTNGYQLRDVETAQIIEGRQLAVMKVKSQPDFSLKIQTRTDATPLHQPN